VGDVRRPSTFVKDGRGGQFKSRENLRQVIFAGVRNSRLGGGRDVSGVKGESISRRSKGTHILLSRTGQLASEVWTTRGPRVGK